MKANNYFDDISPLPFKRECIGYSWNTLGADLMAAFNVALLTVPQAMAFALLTGLPIQCSLLASIFSAFAVALFSSSSHLIVGQSNAIAILLQAGCAELMMIYKQGLSPLEYEAAAFNILMQITFLAALMQILAAGCRLGRLTQFVSYSVIIGYVIGTSIAVIINQLYAFFGISTAVGIHSLFEKIAYLVSHLSDMHITTTLLGSGCLLLLLILKHINRRLPIAVITFTLAAITVQLLLWAKGQGWIGSVEHFLSPSGSKKILLVGDLGSTASIIPSVAFPFFEMHMISSMLPIAFAVALLSVLETTSVAKTLAASSGQRVSLNQEILALGLGNVTSALVGAVPITGSSSRTMQNYSNGAKTRFSALFCSVFVAAICVLLSFFIAQIPLAALSAVLLFTTFQFINKKHFLLCLRATNADAFVLWLTLFSCLFFSFDVAFYIGIILSIVLYLKKAAMPQLIEYDIDETGELHNISAKNHHEHKIIRVIKVEGELFFGAADLFQATLKAIAEDDTSTRVIILQLKNARDIDATTCLALQRMFEYMNNSGRYLVICGIMLPVWEVFCNAGLIQEIGAENLIPFDERHPHQHMQRALARAKMLIHEEKHAEQALQNSDHHINLDSIKCDNAAMMTQNSDKLPSTTQ